MSSYQSVSGAGHRGVSELLDQVEKLHGDEESLARPEYDALPRGEVFGKPIAYNVVARVGDFEADGFTGEEAKMMAESPKILELPDLPVVATSVRVPVIVGHGVSVLAAFSRPIDVRSRRRPASSCATIHRRASTRRPSRQRGSTLRSRVASARCPGATTPWCYSAAPTTSARARR